MFPQLAKWAKENAVELGLQPHVDKERPISVAAAHSTVRIDVDGQPQVVTVLQVVQRRPDLAAADHRLDGIVPKAGATVVIDAAGVVRYVISKSLPAAPRRRGPGPTSGSTSWPGRWTASTGPIPGPPTGRRPTAGCG